MNIRNLKFDELESEVIRLGFEKFRAKQIFEWLHKHFVIDFDKASNIGTELKSKLYQSFDFSVPTIYKEFVSKIDGTKKYLISLNDNYVIESVLMKYKYGYSVCISSEVGCDMGCKFCASTIGGLKRNLEPYELLSQVYLIEKHNNINISNIVIMGSGEPLANLNNILKFLNIINDKNGKNISMRNITLSTCGIVESINRLSDYKLPITLALSLHAPNNEIRKEIMPIANKYDLKDVMEAMANYFIITNRRITFEYSLIDGLNNSDDNANELVDLFHNSFKNKHIDFNVNLIPVNTIKESNFVKPDNDKVNSFKRILENNNINVTIRRELGKDISGSCGQLRASVK